MPLTKNNTVQLIYNFTLRILEQLESFVDVAKDKASFKHSQKRCDSVLTPENQVSSWSVSTVIAMKLTRPVTTENFN